MLVVDFESDVTIFDSVHRINADFLSLFSLISDYKGIEGVAVLFQGRVHEFCDVTLNQLFKIL